MPRTAESTRSTSFTIPPQEILLAMTSEERRALNRQMLAAHQASPFFDDTRSQDTGEFYKQGSMLSRSRHSGSDGNIG